MTDQINSQGILAHLWAGVNFAKSSLIGVNVDYAYMVEVDEFLHFKKTYLHFKYLRLLVGKTPRLEFTHAPLVTLIKIRLLPWSHEYVSLGEE